MPVIDNETIPAAAVPPTSPTPEAEEAQTDEPAAPAIQTLLGFIDHRNIAETLDENVLGQIGQIVTREFEIDVNSRSDWEKQNKQAMDLAMQVMTEKSYPWPNAANVKYPLLTTAAIQFQARAYPAIVPGADIAKAKVVGYDPENKKQERAGRIGKHLSYQLGEQMENWEPDTDRLLVLLPLEGSVFRKTYFDPRLGRNCSDLVRAIDLVVNYKAKSLDAAPRVTQVFKLYPHEIEERIRAKTYLDIDLGLAANSNDADEPHEMLEQHRLYDLDDDGYPEPYICTIHKASGKVMRIVARFDLDGIETRLGGVGEFLRKLVGTSASIGMSPQQAVQAVLPRLVDEQIIRIEPVRFFTKYPFIPNPESAIYDLGFGMLLNPMNEAVNTVLNQMLDAGTLANMGGGFIGSGIRMKAGALRFTPGEYKKVDSAGANLKENVVPLQFGGPNAVLFQLLGLLIDAGRDIASVKDILTGDQPQANVPATTTLALIEQGMKVFTAIYKRVHRSLKEELKKLYRLNRLYLKQEEYFRILDGDPQKVTIEDYNDRDIDVCPFSDPSVSTEAQRLARAQAALQFMGAPFSNPVEIARRYYEAIGEENPEALFDLTPKGPPPELIKSLKELELKQRELQLKALQTVADTILKLAQAEAAEPGRQMDIYIRYLEALATFNGASNAAPANDTRGVPGMALPPGNGGVLPVSGGLPADAGGPGAGAVPGGDAGLMVP